MLITLQLLIVLAMIVIGAKVGGIGLGIYGMLGVSILVFVFGLAPGSIPIDVMLIIVSVITASSALQLGECGGAVPEEAPQPYHLPGTACHLALHADDRHGPYLLCAAAYHL